MDEIEQKGLIIAEFIGYPEDKKTDWVRGFTHGYKLGKGSGRTQAEERITKMMLRLILTEDYTSKINYISKITDLPAFYIKSLHREEEGNNGRE